MGTLIYDPEMDISVVDKSIPEEESSTPSLDTSLSALFVGFTSKGKHNAIVEHKSPASLMNMYGDDFGSYTKYGQANLAALGITRSQGRAFFCSLLPKDAKRAYVCVGVSVTTKADIPVYERTDTIYSGDKTAISSYGTGAFVLDANGNKVQCKVKSTATVETADTPVTVAGVSISFGTKDLTDKTYFSEDGAPSVYDGTPIVTTAETSTTTFYPLFTCYYYSNGKGGNDFGFTINRDVGRDKKLTDGRRYYMTFYKLLSTGSYTALYDEPFYFSFNPKAKFSEDSTVQEGLSAVYLNQDSSGNEYQIQMKVYDSNYDKLTAELVKYQDSALDVADSIDFVNGLSKSGIKYTKIVLADDSINPSSTTITLGHGTDGSIQVGNGLDDGTVVTTASAEKEKEALLLDFFNCNVDNDIFDEKITDIDLLPDCNYPTSVKKVILSTFAQYRPDIALKIDVGVQSNYTSAIAALNELTPYIYSKYSFMVSFNAHAGILTDAAVGSPYEVTYTYDYVRGMADNFASGGGAFQMHAGANRGLVKYFRPYWYEQKDKAGSMEKLKNVNLNYIEKLNKAGTLMYGMERTQYPTEGSKLQSDRNALIIGRAMRICHGVLPYYKYDEHNIADTLSKATRACNEALTTSSIPSTVGISVSMYQTKQDTRTNNAHCDITFTFPDYIQSFTVTIIAKRPDTAEATA